MKYVRHIGAILLLAAFVVHCGGGGKKGDCGNMVLDAGEMCDGFDVGTATCASVSMQATPFGTLACTASCEFDTTGCSATMGMGGMSSM